MGNTDLQEEKSETHEFFPGNITLTLGYRKRLRQAPANFVYTRPIVKGSSGIFLFPPVRNKLKFST